MKENLRTASICVQGGYEAKNGEPIEPPIIQSTTFKYDNSEEMAILFDLKKEGYFYTRLQNPTNDVVAKKIAQQNNVTVGTSVSNVMRAFEKFVNTQSDAALRQVAGLYAYDNNEGSKDELTLRDDADEINKQLESKLDERLSMAGIEVVEARINYLAYAPEIAAVMLRRQQAAAIISAREKIVEGAVSMVKMALDKLSNEEIVELDDDKKAAMVSNLLVVLCGDDSAQPVVNAGTLNH